MDKVIIKNLLVRGIIGINDWERKRPQDILINITLFTDTRRAAETDNINDCVNYSTVSKKVQEHAESAEKLTVEALANELLKLCLEEQNVQKVVIRVEKPGAVRFAESVGVEIERSRVNELHKAYLNLGSNIQPELNLVKAIQGLSETGEVREVSNAWGSRAAGAPAPDYLNACVLFFTQLNKFDLKEKIIRPIEAKLGRVRSEDKYIPRTIDIDIILFDDQLQKDSFWNDAFVVIPLAEIYPEYQNPVTRKPITEISTQLQEKVWMQARPEVLNQFRENPTPR